MSVLLLSSTHGHSKARENLRLRWQASHSSYYKDAVELSFSAYNQTLTLHLLPNHQLVHQNAMVKFMILNQAKPLFICLFYPAMCLMENNQNSLMAVRLRMAGLESFNTPNFDNGEEVLFDGVIQSGPNMLCEANQTLQNITTTDGHRVASPFSRQPDSWGANMMVFTDEAQAVVEERWGQFPTGAALAQILSNWNQASKIYESTFNVRLAVVKVSLQQSCTPTNPQMIWNQDCTSGYTITTRLSDFSNWRGNIESNGDGIGLWHLMTKCSTQPAVGVVG
ncbi:hypothetical protein BSLG_005672 [Batrachochytrium salamandrivorans]|nr:hypothetical protein BSLG_005672 [Batrachochytrium salamandrivorans]